MNRQTRAELAVRLDALVASVPAEAIPFGSEVSIWQSANDGGLKWAMVSPVKARGK